MRSSRGDESRMVIRERERKSYSGDLKRFVAREKNKDKGTKQEYAQERKRRS